MKYYIIIKKIMENDNSQKSTPHLLQKENQIFKEPNKRLKYIDVVKFIGLFCIIYDHTLSFIELKNNFTLIRRFFCGWHMPLYFFIYGMNTSSLPKNFYSTFQFFNKKFQRLMVPYFIWCLIYANGLNSFNRKFFYGILYGSNLMLGEVNTNRVLWFLPCFFFSIIIYQFITNFNYILSKRGIQPSFLAFIQCIILGFLTNFLTNKSKFGFPFSFDVSFTGVIYMLFGYFLKPIIETLYSLNNLVKLFICLCLLIICFFVSNFNVSPNSIGACMALGDYGKSYILYIFNSLLGVIGILSLSMLFENIEIFSWFGKGSIFFMSSHYIFLQLTIPVAVEITKIIPFFYNELLPLYSDIILHILSIPFLFLIEVYSPILMGEVHYYDKNKMKKDTLLNN